MTKTLPRPALLLTGLLALSACSIYDPTPRPDYAIRVTPTAQGGVATPPACPSYATATADPFDNQPMPQFGCADARNLAMEVETPNDLVHPREMGGARGVESVGAIRRYDNNQTRGLIVPGAEDNTIAATTSSSATSSMSGDVTGGGGSSSSASSSSSGATSVTAP
ncbi:MAG: hypothetical protein KGI37_01045 [Alphaproteobacteria bacterium]|nr:hypothetical protein [Alphaproteobacteria bacterium]